MSYHTQQLREAIILKPSSAATASVIWLHGLGADGGDFVPLVPQLHLPAAVAPRFVFPHAPVRPITINGGAPMRGWYDIQGLTRGDREDAVGIRQSAALVETLIRQERAAGMPANRIVLAGFSQGGAMALHTGLRHVERLAGILALSTYLPLAAGVQTEAAGANRDLPILMCHGRGDPMISLEFARLSCQRLRGLGYAVSFKEYPMQHQLCEQEITDISAWLAAVLAPQAAPRTG